MKKYRVYYSHCGDAPTDEIRFFKNDSDALDFLSITRSLPSYGMDKIWMTRIDVEEKSSRIDI